MQTKEDEGKSNFKEELGNLISDLIQIKTENPPGNEGPCAKYIKNWFQERGIDSELVFEPYEERPQVVARLGREEPILVLNGHMDVVPAGDPSKWAHDAFSGEIVDGKVYGRGTADMKGGLAVGMMAMAGLKDEIEKDELSGSIIFQGAIGEETAEPGTKTLLEKGFIGDYGVVLEPSELKVAACIKGVTWYRFTIKGEPAHAGVPEKGTNAIIKARLVLDALVEYDREISQRKHELVGQAHSSITEFIAGTKENVVPENAKIIIDRRFLPTESIEEIDDEIESLVEKVKEKHELDITWERTKTYEAACISPDDKIAKVFRKYSSEISGTSPEPWGMNCGTDARNFVNDAGIPAISWGPGKLSQAHSYDEHVDISEAAAGIEILKKSARELLSE